MHEENNDRCAYNQQDSSHSQAYHQYSCDRVNATRELEIERKHFRFEVCKNDRARFLRITKEGQGHCNVVIVPDSDFQAFASKYGIVSTISAIVSLRCTSNAYEEHGLLPWPLSKLPLSSRHSI